MATASAPPGTPATAFSLGPREFVVMLALTQALQALAIDGMLPALGHIATDLKVTSANQRQLIVGVFLGGIAIGSLLPGSLADRFGRRPVLFAALAMYMVMSLACALAPSFEAMIAFRFIAAMGSGALAVIPLAMIRDRFEGDKMARLQSTMSMIFMVVPMIAPTLGQIILDHAGWRWIFGMMAVFGAAMTAWIGLRLPETLHPEFRQPIRPAVMLGNMRAAISNRDSIGYILGSSLVLGAMWGYLQCSQQLVAEHFGAGERFAYIFGGMALFMSGASFTNSRIVERFGARRVSHTAAIGFVLASALQVFLATRAHQALWQFIPVMTLNMILMAFMGANFSSIAIQPFARIAGSASSMQSFVRLVLASGVGAVVGQAYDGTARPLALALLVAGAASLGLVLYSERGVLFRRLLPPGTPRDMGHSTPR